MDVLYLGRIGATSDKIADKVLPILDDALKTAGKNEIDWIFEGFLNIADQVNSDSQELIKRNAELQLNSKKKATQNRAIKILKKIG